MKTEFGTFDISTSEGRQQWIKAMNEYNAPKKPSPVPSQDSADSAPESAKIEFIIPKITSTRVPAVSTENVDSAKECIVTDSPPTTPDVVPLTLDEIKAKLDESVQKNYRRVFIPGRGWASLRKLQEEAAAMESPATA